MDERENTGWGSSKVDLNAMSDEELMGLISSALDRLAPTRFSEVIDTVYAKRRAKRTR